MKRSEVNAILQQTLAFFARQDVHLPRWAEFTLAQWRQRAREEWQEVFDLKLGWDVTSFGSDNFQQQGLTLFTLRNGSPDGVPYAKCYAEKIMHCREAQVTPLHFHWRKREDIINRAGGNLIVELYNRDGEALAGTPVTVAIDGFRQTHAAGTQIRLSPGESITLPPGICHSFWSEAGLGDVLTGEVSMINDDERDNYFLTPVSRFNPLEDDEAPRWLLCNEYGRYLP
ncbi:D-lyxose/D-mannose family sugar isomerase [Erwiniaceae bacterium BAC15a-03b]|uniref:D-lyxose ketol-isomerase n=1 Tax=Winslowiella arboricola TaxID=2978220 RepID=A0A9J6PU59_9GAMM|nr:D-lyxose/D-mannose family sugar isomerase [Winslowiella arboricola]MCU5772558.1 D-lyxose/D-mannose family sugar isomerase [Winslowiella arboricola]MCU5779080.1 D-lyxose/D-mannose family sugar isomerase [Winslowiella arboricola]